MSDHAPYSILSTLAEFGIPNNLAISTNVTITAYLNKLTNSKASKHRLVNNSRDLNTGDIFCAVLGSTQDGRNYIDQAIESGVSLVIAECQNKEQHGNVIWCKTPKQLSKNTNVTQQIAIIEFYQLNHYLFSLANTYYQQPKSKMLMIGITGTNGKTSTSQLIAQLLEKNDRPCAVIGTNGAGRLGNLTPIKNTTPGATELSQLLAQFVTEDISHLAMEVSSHALEQRRVTNDLFNIAVFTNLSRDHLDFHQTMESYAQAKRKLFTNEASQIAIINGDDAISQQWLKDWPTNQPTIVYGRSNRVTKYQKFVYADDIKHHSSGVSFILRSHLGDVDINSPLMADFNVDNLLAAIAVLLTEAISLTDIATNVASLTPIIGRMEKITKNDQVTAVVDYAHTPDALENALLACRQHCQGKLWVVFGCGGDRDKGKRALMGEVAERLADNIVLTNDNPRSETPEMIVSDILSGCQYVEKITVILDRQQAALSTLSLAKKDDIVLLAGKGHEENILIGNKNVIYNERDVVNSFFQKEEGL
jgi:UDP-N-acetylmuramoyl-L-alanyl-D-glutamate--2,6-diaminopimelate ligase